MTYCLSIRVDQGLVFASDSRTNAGVDQVSTFSKMHTFEIPGERAVCLLTAGNLATTQAVVRQIRRDNEAGTGRCMNTVADMAEAAEYVGELSRAEQRKHASRQREKFNPEASFIVGGQIAGRPHQIYLVYPEGNYIAASVQTPYLQTGELKYGKPILDRVVSEGLSLDVGARAALVSMDSTMRSNATVGPPIELLLYTADSLRFGKRLVLQEDNAYLRELRTAWQEGLKQAFTNLPSLPLSRPAVKLVGPRGDS
ncbi:peptidase [Elongatibacter sediminis]|uniref:Peptidase n=1 Tax=Elongatibacter sediminis TaxID=3119006 RepID=A0AAW9R7Q2_9GAMM